MKLVLDTHAVLWSLLDSPRLSERVRAALVDPQVVVLVSAVSTYELAFKAALGKLPPLPAPLAELAVAQGFALLPVNHRHAELAAGLPLVSRDPWDRILVAQAMAESALLVSADAAVTSLGATVFW